MKSPQKILTRSAAFSLVEVILALGLVTFAVTVIVGLLPVGLTSINQSMNQTIEAQILRSISSQSVVADFRSLATSGLYFDREGQPTTMANAYYDVRVTTNAPVYPGSTEAAGLRESIVTLKIEMIARPSSTAAGSTNKYTLHVANSGK